MKKTLQFKFRLLLLGLAMMCGINSAIAQVTSTINATGTTGSYATGSVNATGTKNDGLMVGITQTTNRGWAVFDLSSIPAGSTVSSVTLKFTTTSNSVSSTVTNYIGGYQWSAASDPATLAGASLYTMLNADASNNFDASVWTANALQTKALNAAAVNFIANNLTGKVVISFVRGSTNNYEIYGYGATATQQPQLQITYTVNPACAGAPNSPTITAPSAVCATVPFTLSASGVSVGPGISYDWQYYDNATSTWVSTGSVAPSYTVSTGITTATDYRFITTCSNSGLGDTSNTISLAINGPSSCYCIPTGATTTYGIQDFSTTGGTTNISNLGSGLSMNGYGDFTSMTLTGTPSATIDFSTSFLTGTNGFAIFIDWDQDGSFTQPGDLVYNTTNYMSSPLTGTFVIPLTAPSGNTRMRIIGNYLNSNPSNEYCSSTNYTYAEWEDYTVNVLPLLPCSTLDPATASGPSNVCANAPFTLSASGMTIGLGITYEWEYDDGSGAGWQSTGATTPVYTVASGISTPTTYRFVTTCANGGTQDFSLPITVGINPFYFCYCSPLTGVTINSGYAYNYINNVNITGTTLNNSSTTVGANSYTQYDPSISTNTALLIPGLNYTINIGKTYSYDEVGVWLDFDGDGLFSATEQIPVTGSSATFTVPTTATAGMTGLRVRVNDWTSVFTATMACDDRTYSETEDYVVEIATLIPCSNVDPVTVSGPSGVCSGIPFTLTATGMTVGSGITYEWQYYDNATSSWLVAGTTPAYTVSAGITTATDYRFVTTCSNGGAQDISTTVSISMNLPTQCYCIPTYTYDCGSGDNIDDVILTGDAAPGINNQNTACPPGGYADYTSMSATLTAGNTYNGNVTTSYGSPYENVRIWIDFDQNGAFDASETIATLTNISSSSTGAISFTLPTTVAAGNYTMRVRLVYNTPPTSIDPCIDYAYGETHDYTVNIQAAVPCSGQPAVATASGPANVCANAPFTLSATGMTLGLGLTYDWQYDDGSGAGWQSTGGTTPTYTVATGISAPMTYRFVTTCANGGNQDFSLPISVGINPFYFCYCSPLTGVTINSGYAYNYINNVNITGTTLNNSSTTVGASSYTQYDPSISTNTATLTPGLNYTINIGKAYSYDEVGVWLDFDGDGLFSATEHIPVTGSSATFTVPTTATAGLTGLRVRVNDWTSVFTATMACDDRTYSETEDYVVEIAALVPCTGTPNVVTASAPATVCPSTPVTLTATGMTIGSGITYDWQYYDNATSTWLSTGGTTPVYTVSAGITTPTDYRFVTTCTGSSMSDTSNVVSVALNSFMNCYCNSAFTSVTYEYVTNVTYAGINNTSAGVTGGPVNFTTQTGYVSPGVPNDLSVTIVADGSEYIYAFIDWNQNGILNDAGEVYTVASSTAAAGPHVLSITPPLTAAMGNTRMRVMVDWNNAIPDPCRSATYGEAEDYTLNVGAPPTCVPPTPLNATNITATSADVSWTAVGNAVGYEWAVDNTSTLAPDAATTVNTATTAGTVNVTNLTGSNTYYLHVRTDCGGGDYSAWAVYAFATPPLNDDCANAIDISNQMTIPGTTSGAAQSMVACDATATANDVWYSFTTGSVGGSVTVTAVSTLADLVLQVFSGTCGSFTPMMPTACSAPTLTTCIDGPAAGTEYGTFTVAANTTYYVRVYGYNGSQGTFTMGATGTPLAVKLTSITATNAGSRNRVDWITASEDRGDYFEVERSVDGSNFTKIGSVNGKGTGANYSFWDNTPVNGVNYYRLKMMEQSGSYQYSNTVKATVKDVNAFSVEAFPNPVTENSLTVKVYGTSGANATVSLSDLTGKVIKVVSVNANTVTIDMRGLAAGVYLIKYADDNHSQTIKINKN